MSRYQQACSDLKRKDQQIAELQRRCEDSKRAYEQEKLEREQKEKKIQQLEKSQKVHYIYSLASTKLVYNNLVPPCPLYFTPLLTRVSRS